MIIKMANGGVDSQLKTDVIDEKKQQMEDTLGIIKEQIAELKDNSDKTEDKIEWLNRRLTADFAKYLKPEIAQELLNNIKNKYEVKTDADGKLLMKDLPEWLWDLINFLEPIANPFENELEDGDVAELKKDEVTKWKFYGSLEGLNNKPEDKNNEGETEVKKLNNLEQLNKSINDALDSIPKDKDGKIDERFNKLQSTLFNIQKVVGNPTKPNTQKLQKFIWENCYKNLDSKDKDRTSFEKDNHMKKNWEFDGQFWDATLKWLYKLLGEIQHRINDVKEAIVVEKNNSSEGIDKSKNKDETEEKSAKPEISGAWKNEKKTEVSKNLPETYEFGWNHYTLVNNYQDYASKCGLPGAAFYLPNVNNLGNQWESQPQGLEAFPEWWDMDAIMKYWNDYYNVKLDKNLNLKPTAINTNSNVDVLFENNASCINYLINKLHDKIADDCVIAWNEKMKDYVIRLKGQESGVAIEPMEIDGHWFWYGDIPLDKCLTLLHFTNILKKPKGGINDLRFANDDPDLKWNDEKKQLLVNVKKNNKVKDLSGLKDWYPIPLDNYWLGFLRTDEYESVRNSFMRYNNWEHWKDEWDKKKGNKEYVKKKLEGLVQVGMASVGNVSKASLDWWQNLNQTL